MTPSLTKVSYKVTEQDHLGIDLMVDAAKNNSGAATSPGTYTAAPSTGEAWVNNFLPTKKLFNSVELLDRFEFCLN